MGPVICWIWCVPGGFFLLFFLKVSCIGDTINMPVSLTIPEKIKTSSSKKPDYGDL